MPQKTTTVSVKPEALEAEGPVHPPDQKTIAPVKAKWKPVAPVVKQQARLKTYEVHSTDNKGSKQIIENVEDSTAAIAQYVKDNKLVSYHHTFRTVEMQAA